MVSRWESVSKEKLQFTQKIQILFCIKISEKIDMNILPDRPQEDNFD